MTKVSVLKKKQIKEIVLNSLKRVRVFRIELRFGKVGFCREGKTIAPREKPLGKAEKQQQT